MQASWSYTRRALRLLTALGLTCVASCGKEPENASRTASDGPVHGGTVVIALGQEPESLIPYGTRSHAASRIETFMFRFLADTNPNFDTFRPSIARDWEWSDDHLALTMYLRDDVYWHDGVQVTAADVQFSWEVARDENVGWHSRHWKSDVTACEIIDPFTVRFQFSEVFLEQFRFAKEGFVVPKHLLENVPRDQWSASEFARAPVGCGPFKFERWEPGQRIVLVRNDNYFASPKPYLDRVVIEFINEPSTRSGLLRAGDVDFVPDLPLRDAAELREAFRAGTSDLHIKNIRARGYDFIGYNSKDPLFGSRKVREALTRAIDRKTIVEKLCHGFAEVFESPIVPILWAYDPDQPVTPFDPEGATRLLSEEGWRDNDGDGWLDKDGRRFEFELMTNSDNALRMQAIVAVQEYWRKIGVKCNLRTLEMQTALSLRAERKYQAYYGGWSAGLSPSATLQGLWSCTSAPKNNFTDYCNPRVDSLNLAAWALLDPKQARPLFHEIQSLVVQDHPYTWMYYDHDVVGYSDRVYGIVVDQRGLFLNMEEWYVPEERQSASR